MANADGSSDELGRSMTTLKRRLLDRLLTTAAGAIFVPRTANSIRPAEQIHKMVRLNTSTILLLGFNQRIGNGIGVLYWWHDSRFVGNDGSIAAINFLIVWLHTTDPGNLNQSNKNRFQLRTEPLWVNKPSTHYLWMSEWNDWLVLCHFRLGIGTCCVKWSSTFPGRSVATGSNSGSTNGGSCSSRDCPTPRNRSFDPTWEPGGFLLSSALCSLLGKNHLRQHQLIHSRIKLLLNWISLCGTIFKENEMITFNDDGVAGPIIASSDWAAQQSDDQEEE